LLDGGSGDDMLEGGPDADYIVLGPGNDIVHAGAGDDELQDEEGTPSTALFESDTIDGGPGRDQMLYDRRGHPLTVDLRAPFPQGAPGENDTLTGVESIAAQAARSRLVGDDHANDLSGGAHSTLIGKGGDDYLDAPSETRDVLSGGRGDDTLHVVPPKADRVSCGPGRDSLYFDDPLPAQYVPPDCERVDPEIDGERVYTLHPWSRQAIATVRCSGESIPCTTVYGARRGGSGPVLARSGRYRRTRRPYARVTTLRLTPAGRVLLERRGRVRVQLGSLDGGFAGEFTTTLVRAHKP
jgi:hypothetical protein